MHGVICKYKGESTPALVPEPCTLRAMNSCRRDKFYICVHKLHAYWTVRARALVWTRHNTETSHQLNSIM